MKTYATSNMASLNIRLNPFGVVLFLGALVCMLVFMLGFPASLFRREQRISMRELLSVSIELAHRGGEKVVEVRRSPTLDRVVKGKTKEGAADYKTEGDMQSHRAIIHGLQKAFPGIKVISEEHDTEPIAFEYINDVNKQLTEVTNIIKNDQQVPIKDIAVWVDPLDATQEYQEGDEGLLRYVTVMVCVAVKGEPTIGVVYSPFLNETNWAWVNFGNSANLQKPVGATTQTDEYVDKIIISRSHRGTAQDVIEGAFKSKVTVVKAAGAGYKTLALLKGEADAYFHSTLIKKWDICAGNAILSHFDAKMTDMDKNLIDYSSSDSAENTKGLLATITNHFKYLDKLRPVYIADKTKEKNTKKT